MPTAKNTLMAAAVAFMLTSCSIQQNKSVSLYSQGMKQLIAHNYEQAEFLLSQAITQAEKDVGEIPLTSTAPSAKAHSRLADALTALGHAYFEQGRFAAAREPLEKAVREYELAARRHDNGRVAAALNELAVCYHKQAQYQKAKDAALRALAIREKLFGPLNILVASSCNNLAEICVMQKDDAGALSFFTKALAIYQHLTAAEAIRGRIHTLNNLSLYYSRNSKHVHALEMVNQALAIAESKSSSLKPGDLAASLLCRAGIEKATFSYKAAEDDFMHAIGLLNADPVAKHGQLCEALDSYADLLFEQRRHSEAEPLYQAAIQHCKKAHGSEHPCVAERLNDLAELYEKDDKYSQAETLLKEALQINKLCFDSDSPIVVKTINDLAQVYVHQKKFDLAEKVYEDWTPQLEQVLGKDHPRVADALDNWAMVATRANKKEEAVKLRDRAKLIKQTDSIKPITDSLHKTLTGPAP